MFDNAWPPLLHAFSARDQQMADTIGGYWAGLVLAGDVNGGKGKPAVQWPRWDKEGMQSMSLQVPSVVKVGLHADVCDFWDELAALSQDAPMAYIRQTPLINAERAIRRE